MTVGGTPLGSIVLINFQLLQTFLLGLCAWWSWPSSPEWWGFGLLSIMLGATSFGTLMAALRAMAKLYAREKAIARLAGTSRAPEASDLVNRDALKNAGMIHD